MKPITVKAMQKHSENSQTDEGKRNLVLGVGWVWLPWIEGAPKKTKKKERYPVGPRLEKTQKHKMMLSRFPKATKS